MRGLSWENGEEKKYGDLAKWWDVEVAFSWERRVLVDGRGRWEVKSDEER